jgi:hypothetical protein
MPWHCDSKPDGAFMRKVLWVSIPTVAVPVQIAIDAEDHLDLLSETVLRLMEAGAQSIQDVVRKLAIPEDIVQSAVNLLMDEQLCKVVEGSKELFVASNASDSHIAGRALAPGWVFVAPHTASLLPAVWLDRDLPSPRVSIDMPACVKDVDLDFELRMLPGWPSLRIEPLGAASEEDADDDEASDDDDAGADVSFPDLPTTSLPERGALRVRSILRDQAREPIGGPWKRTCVWSKVVLIPRVSDRPLAVFHAPVVSLPEDSDSAESDGPVDERLGQWIKTNVPDVYAEVENRCQELHEMSHLPTVIGSAAELERRVTAHRKRAGWTVDDLHSVLPVVADWVDTPHRNLVQWQAGAPTYRDACSGYEHLIEQIGVELRHQSRDHVLGWWEQLQRLPRQQQAAVIESRVGERNVTEAFDRIGLREAVAGSFTHLCRSVESARKVVPAVQLIQSDKCGFGESITIWLLPLVLCDPPSVAAHSQLVAAAVRYLPGLFNDLDSLRITRDTFAHNRELDTEAAVDLVHVDAVCRRVCDAIRHAVQC